MTNNAVLLSPTSLKLHHTVVKAAQKRGIYFVGATEGKFRLGKVDDPALLSSEEFDTTAEAFEAFDGGEVTFLAPRQEMNSSANKCGVMSGSFHSAYSHNPHGPGSNDQLDCFLRDRLMVKPDGKGKPKVDVEALRATGEANGLWRSAWETLNPGMMRMNLSNRIRAWLRNNDGNIQVCDAQGEILLSSRFGIAQKVKAVKTKE